MNTIAEPGSSTGSAAAAARKCARVLTANVWSHWAVLVLAIPCPSPMPTFSTMTGYSACVFRDRW